MDSCTLSFFEDTKIGQKSLYDTFDTIRPSDLLVIKYRLNPWPFSGRVARQDEERTTPLVGSTMIVWRRPISWLVECAYSWCWPLPNQSFGYWSSRSTHWWNIIRSSKHSWSWFPSAGCLPIWAGLGVQRANRLGCIVVACMKGSKFSSRRI